MTAVVQTNKGGSGSSVTSFNLAYASSVSANNTLVAVAGTIGTGVTFTLSDSVNGTWPSTVLNANGGSRSLSFLVLPSTLAGTPTVTFTPSASTTVLAGLFEISGSSGTVDKTATNSAGGAATSSSMGPTGTLASNNDIAIAATVLGTNSAGWAAGGSYTLITPTTSFYGIEYFVVPNTAAQTATFTWTTTTGYAGGLITLLAGTPITGTDTLLGQGWV